MTDRTKFIGGSDAAAVVGLSRWKSPIELWAEKTGQVEPEDVSDKMAVRVGKKLESAVAEFFEEETGKKFKYKIRGFIIPHAKRYETIFEQARRAAYSDHVQTYRTSDKLNFKFNEKMKWKK